MNILLLAGSTHVSSLMKERAVEAVEKASQLGWGVVCADEYGICTTVMESCLYHGVPLLVYSIMPYPFYYNGPLDNFEYLACTKPRRDEFMCELADTGLFLWNGHGKEVRHGFNYMAYRLRKPAWLYDYGGLRRARVTMNEAALSFEIYQQMQ